MPLFDIWILSCLTPFLTVFCSIICVVWFEIWVITYFGRYPFHIAYSFKAVITIFLQSDHKLSLSQQMSYKVVLYTHCSVLQVIIVLVNDLLCLIAFKCCLTSRLLIVISFIVSINENFAEVLYRDDSNEIGLQLFKKSAYHFFSGGLQ